MSDLAEVAGARLQGQPGEPAADRLLGRLLRAITSADRRALRRRADRGKSPESPPPREFLGWRR